MRRPEIKSIKMQLVAFIFLMMMMASVLTGILVLLSIYLQVWGADEVRLGLRFPLHSITLVFLIVSSIIGSCLSLGFSQRFLHPIYTLIEAMKEIRKGNYHVRVKGGGKNQEIGLLIQNFNAMAEELEGVEMLKSDFINYFSHEFKTPIISIQGFAKQLQNENTPGHKREEYREIIVKEAERLVKLSTNTLLLTKLESQKIITDQKSFHLDEQIRHCILLLQKEWEEKGLELDLDLSEATVFGNEEMLSQIWINLIGNAVAYSNPGGTLTVSCKPDGQRFKVRIQDEGVGMSDEVSARIFDKFYQGDASRSTKGNGLGLAIVKRIVDLCQGSISVKSQEGKGAVFIVYLPKS
ncbi:MAG: HAMP domain-containing histidine kinase [Turicibacter sp.]|nr:HAMP domain-containing histidine kinase [Turicibacter sp.]